MVSVVPRGDGPVGSGAEGRPREPGPRPGAVRAAPTLFGAVRAVVMAVLRHPEAALVTAIVVAVVGDVIGWW
jgi:hypothetical protein